MSEETAGFAAAPVVVMGVQLEVVGVAVLAAVLAGLLLSAGAHLGSCWQGSPSPRGSREGPKELAPLQEVHRTRHLVSKAYLKPKRIYLNTFYHLLGRE